MANVDVSLSISNRRREINLSRCPMIVQRGAMKPRHAAALALVELMVFGSVGCTTTTNDPSMNDAIEMTCDQTSVTFDASSCRGLKAFCDRNSTAFNDDTCERVLDEAHKRAVKKQTMGGGN